MGRPGMCGAATAFEVLASLLAHSYVGPVHACCRCAGDPAPLDRGEQLKQGIHPDYVETTVTCTCGNTFTTRSTAKNGVIHADVCSNCHPFYTGKQKILDTGGRVARFESRYGKKKVAPK
jgi:large subunit ribosomal protein L31